VTFFADTVFLLAENKFTATGRTDGPFGEQVWALWESSKHCNSRCSGCYERRRYRATRPFIGAIGGGMSLNKESAETSWPPAARNRRAAASAEVKSSVILAPAACFEAASR